MIKAELLALQAEMLRAIAADLDRMSLSLSDTDEGNAVVTTSDTLTFKMPEIGKTVLYSCTTCYYTYYSLVDFGDTLSHERSDSEKHMMKKVK